MDYRKKIITDIGLHSVDGISECFQNGVSSNDNFRDEPLIYELISEYTRTPRFKDCVKAFVSHGLEFDDKALLAVLMDDAVSLNSLIINDPQLLSKKYKLRCAYTPLYDVNLLHICAEFNHLSCARVLIEQGVDVNVKAGVDEYGFGGQTPIFHTVNQNGNNSFEVLNYFLSLDSVDLKYTVPGLIWGKGYEWETFIPAVNPVSYAMMGLLPQMHRREDTIAQVVSLLLKKAFGIDYKPTNIPCAYLKAG